jgi:hypothetical protein
MQRKLSAIFVTGKIGIADKPEMGFQASLGESFAQTGNAAGNATGPGITVRAFKAEYVILRDGILHVARLGFLR